MCVCVCVCVCVLFSFCRAYDNWWWLIQTFAYFVCRRRRQKRRRRKTIGEEERREIGVGDVFGKLCWGVGSDGALCVCVCSCTQERPIPPTDPWATRRAAIYECMRRNQCCLDTLIKTKHLSVKILFILREAKIGHWRRNCWESVNEALWQNYCIPRNGSDFFNTHRWC